MLFLTSPFRSSALYGDRSLFGGLQSTEYPDYATVSNRLNFANLVLTFQNDSFVLRCAEYGEIFASERLRTGVSVHRSTGELYKSSRGSCYMHVQHKGLDSVDLRDKQHRVCMLYRAQSRLCRVLCTDSHVLCRATSVYPRWTISGHPPYP